MSDWTPVAPTVDFDDGVARVVEVDGIMVAVFELDGTFVAIEDRCPHDGSEIATGCVKKGILECPHHGATFDLRSGDVLSPPAYENLELLAVRVEDGMVEVRDPRWD